MVCLLGIYVQDKKKSGLFVWIPVSAAVGTGVQRRSSHRQLWELETVRVQGREGQQLRRSPEGSSSSEGKRTKVTSTVDGARQRGAREAIVSVSRKVFRYYNFGLFLLFF